MISYPFIGLALNFYVLDSLFALCDLTFLRLSHTQKKNIVPQNNDFKQVCNHSIHTTQSTDIVRLPFLHSSGPDQKKHTLKAVKVSSESKYNCNSHQIFKDLYQIHMQYTATLKILTLIIMWKIAAIFI